MYFHVYESPGLHRSVITHKEASRADQDRQSFYQMFVRTDLEGTSFVTDRADVIDCMDLSHRELPAWDRPDVLLSAEAYVGLRMACKSFEGLARSWREREAGTTDEVVHKHGSAERREGVTERVQESLQPAVKEHPPGCNQAERWKWRRALHKSG
jgi:hypothetical protein